MGHVVSQMLCDDWPHPFMHTTAASTAICLDYVSGCCGKTGATLFAARYSKVMRRRHNEIKGIFLSE